MVTFQYRQRSDLCRLPVVVWKYALGCSLCAQACCEGMTWTVRQVDVAADETVMGCHQQHIYYQGISRLKHMRRACIS